MISFSTVYGSLGFKKGYNFIFFVTFAGACLGFVLARLPFLNLDGIFCRYQAVVNLLNLYAAPGECYHYDVTRGAERVGIIVHLATILPAMFLACFQFLPIMRYKLLILHRIDGYLVIILFFIANGSALILARNSFEGTIETQTIIGLMVFATTISISLAYYNIKRLQIEQHRAWMLRTFFYASSIITCRIILIIAAIYTSFTDSYYFIQPCFKIAFLYNNTEHPTVDLYPACASFFNGTNLNARVIVEAIFFNDRRPEQIAAALDMTFGMALWLGFFIHVIGIELYLQLTPVESHRLRQISYKRQVDAGFRNPGFSGTTVERYGDAPHWKPDEKDVLGK